MSDQQIHYIYNSKSLTKTQILSRVEELEARFVVGGELSSEQSKEYLHLSRTIEFERNQSLLSYIIQTHKEVFDKYNNR